MNCSIVTYRAYILASLAQSFATRRARMYWIPKSTFKTVDNPPPLGKQKIQCQKLNGQKILGCLLETKIISSLKKRTLFLFRKAYCNVKNIFRDNMIIKKFTSSSVWDDITDSLIISMTLRLTSNISIQVYQNLSVLWKIQNFCKF